MKLLRIYRSPRKGKKLRADFLQDDGSVSHTDFGATGYTDFTKILDKDLAYETRNRYWSRHRKEDGSALDSPGMLSLYILWGWTQDIRENATRYKNLFDI
jgi:hypothetical protein